jgi:translation initiation factor IF-2
MKVHELAKELDIPSKELIEKLNDLGVAVKSHMNVIGDDAVELMREDHGVTAPQTDADKAPAPKEEKQTASEPETEGPKSADKPDAEDVVAVAPGEPAESARSEPAESAEESESMPGEDKVIHVRGGITVKELADDLNVMPNKLIAELMKMKIFAAMTERLDINVAKQIAEKYGFVLKHEKKAVEHSQVLQKQTDEEEEVDKPEDIMPRPPVVTFLGHVDHGKTSLLDKIKNTAVVDGEDGGITQHIGAYSVDLEGRSITFLDTPGHEAFNAMRARGANLTDIAIIVIAADDGIMPQTREAIQHAQAAEVTMIVALNKMDLPGANPDRVKQQLQAEGFAPEDWGGELVCCEVSAQTGKGIDHLLEMILLQADVLELQANPTLRANGYVVEASLEPGMGPTTTLLVKTGTLTVGDYVVSGEYCGRVRALMNDRGIKVKSVPPAGAISCLGFSGVPEAGSEFRVCSSEKVGKILAENARLMARAEQGGASRETSIESLFSQIEQDQKLEFKIILKTDTRGSLEAIIQELNKINSDKAELNIVDSDTSNVTKNDVVRAGSSGATIYSFHVTNEPGVKAACKKEEVEVKPYKIIYELFDDIRKEMTAMLPPLIKRHVRGKAEIKQVFPVGKKDKIAGCIMTSGFVTPKFIVRVLRGDEVRHEGTIASLRHFENEVSLIKEAQECGVCVTDFGDFDIGDFFEFVELEALTQAL